MSAGAVGRWTAWGVMAVLSIGVAGWALFLTATGFEMLGTEIKTNRFPSPLGLELHIAASGFALLTGPFQFLKGLRRAAPGLHRWMGRIYVAACLTGGVAGGAVAMFTTSGPVAGAGFFCLAAAWLLTTSMALRAALMRDFVSHERWMIRSFALTLAAVTLRIYLPPVFIFQLDFIPAYTVIAWMCWVPNLLVAELWLRARMPLRPARLAA